MDFFFAVLSTTVLALGLFSFWRARLIQNRTAGQEREANRRLYELAILKELGERIGYSLNIQQIAEIITSSLKQFISFSLVSYMLLEPEKIIFRVNLEKSVNHEFVEEVKQRMIGALEALLDKGFKTLPTEEILSGAILVDDLREPVGSFFNIPLIISEKVVGVLTVAHTQAGLYREEDMTILYKIVRQASQAISRLQEVVAIEQRKLSSMVESMADGVIMTDRGLRLLMVNPAARRTIDLPAGQEAEIFDFIEKLEGKFDLRSRLEESMEHQRTLGPVEVKLDNRFYQIFVFPVKAKVGVNPEEVLGGGTIFHEITREKEAAQIKEDFISMIVHELRSPIDGIKKISASMAKWNKEKDGQLTKQYATMIHDTSANILELVSDLLDVAKLEAGKFELKIAPADLRAIIRERVRFFETSAKNIQIKLETEIASNLPAVLSLDAHRVAQVLNNLISNALKFTNPEGAIMVKALLHQQGQNLIQEAKNSGLTLRLKEAAVKISALPDSAVVMVEDSGIGISRESQEIIFDKFKQLNPPTTIDEKRGTGLGLVIVKGVVEGQGGLVGVESEVGAGSVFYFTLPLNNQISASSVSGPAAVVNHQKSNSPART